MSEQTATQRRSLAWTVGWPVTLLVLTLGAALVGAMITGVDVGAVNSGVESVAASSQNLLSGISTTLPLGYAFGAGMVSAVNPCGFAMLPAYLGLYLGDNEAAQGRQSNVVVGLVVALGFILPVLIGVWGIIIGLWVPSLIWVFLWIGLSIGGLLSVAAAAGEFSVARLRRAVVVGAVVALGFVVLFGVVGIIIGVGARPLVRFFPWIGLGIGVLLAMAGAWMVSGGSLYTALAERLSARISGAGERGLRGYLLFGLGYGTASLSCTLPIFLTVVGSTLTVGTFLGSAVQFTLYGLGMGMVILTLTVSMALFRGAMVGALRRVLPYIQPVSAVLLLIAGAYIVYYWLTLGGLLDKLLAGAYIVYYWLTQGGLR